MRSVKNEKPTMGLAGLILIKTPSVLILHARASEPNYDSLKVNGAAYQVPTGFKLVVRACKVSNYNATSVGPCFGYGDNISADTVTVPTNNVVLSATGIVNTNSVIGSSNEAQCYFEVPAGKYAYTKGFGGVVVTQWLAELVAV